MSKIVIPITPQTWVRIKSGRHGDQVLFRIPEECRKNDGDPCEEYLSTGKCKHAISKAGLARKKRIERYNKYRLDLFHLAKQAGFMLPTCGWSLYFFMPMPKRWSKRKKLAMHGQFHLGKPDQSNLLKAFEDSLSIADEGLSQMSGLGKFWVNQGAGYIEILIDQPLYNPFGVEFLDKNKLVSMTDLEERRKIRDARKEEIRESRKSKPKVKPIKRIPDGQLFKNDKPLL